MAIATGRYFYGGNDTAYMVESDLAGSSLISTPPISNFSYPSFPSVQNNFISTVPTGLYYNNNEIRPPAIGTMPTFNSVLLYSVAGIQTLFIKNNYSTITFESSSSVLKSYSASQFYRNGIPKVLLIVMSGARRSWRWFYKSLYSVVVVAQLVAL